MCIILQPKYFRHFYIQWTETCVLFSLKKYWTKYPDEYFWTLSHRNIPAQAPVFTSFSLVSDLILEILVDVGDSYAHISSYLVEVQLYLRKLRYSLLDIFILDVQWNLWKFEIVEIYLWNKSFCVSVIELKITLTPSLARVNLPWNYEIQGDNNCC